MNLPSGKTSSISRIRKFLGEDVWEVDLSSLPAWSRLGVRAIRIVQLVLKGFREDDCPLHASALTLSTLMAVVPVLALSLALARGMGGSDAARVRIKSLVTEWTTGEFTAAATTTARATPVVSPQATTNDSLFALPPAPSREDSRKMLSEQINLIVDGAFERVERINFAALGGIGLVLLIFMVVQVLGQVESSFNRVWGVTVGRSLWRRFTDYLSVLFIVPFLILAASTLPIMDLAHRFLGGSADQVARAVNTGSLRYAMGLGMTSLAFTFFFIFMPNTRVRFTPSLVGGSVAGVMLILWLHLCVTLQINVAGYNRIYGSLASFPILLAWLYMSWQIILFGAEVSFALQNHMTYRLEQSARRASAESRVGMALSIVLEAARSMTTGNPGFEPQDYARRRLVSVRFLNEVVDELTNAGLLGQLSGDGVRYVLLKSPDTLTAREVVDCILRSGVRPEALGLSALPAGVEQTLKRFTSCVGDALGSVTIAAILKGSPA
jgi:membrane protein